MPRQKRRIHVIQPVDIGLVHLLITGSGHTLQAVILAAVHLMITGMQELLKTPDDAAAKTQFVGYAGALAEYFNGLAGNLEKAACWLTFCLL